MRQIAIERIGVGHRTGEIEIHDGFGLFKFRVLFVPHAHNWCIVQDHRICFHFGLDRAQLKVGWDERIRHGEMEIFIDSAILPTLEKKKNKTNNNNIQISYRQPQPNLVEFTSITLVDIDSDRYFVPYHSSTSSHFGSTFWPTTTMRHFSGTKSSIRFCMRSGRHSLIKYGAVRTSSIGYNCIECTTLDTNSKAVSLSLNRNCISLKFKYSSKIHFFGPPVRSILIY